METLIEMMPDFNFKIKPNGPVSEKLLEKGISDFISASSFVRQLSYKRNSNKNDLLQLFSENCGTCSTKHALLKQLAGENSVAGLKLMLGIYRMNKQNTPGIADILLKYNMDFIPEAHTYLRMDNEILDFTFNESGSGNFENELFTEIEITPNQITNYKVNFHKTFLLKWLEENKSLSFTLSELWDIREECIAKLSEKKITA
jgi:hypothetical protein